MEQRQQNIVSAAVIVTLFIIGGMSFYHHVEGWTWSQSFYFVSMTMGTVGTGDLSPSTDLSRMFTGVFVLTAVPIVFFALLLIAEVYFKRHFEQIQWKNMAAYHAVQRVGKFTKDSTSLLGKNSFLRKYKEELDAFDNELKKEGLI
ncbi:hypothetical protein AUJ68_02490 [Candidatus Woesearchaeota archaeon CG1_02_57_44]|nr:MAG: hypothetical protein AUJ68_02490 [Candidatus Woesearchaeota archaeon CG1_02_57_44]PIN69057.1 MAG: hypothetical protein COV94_03380 [Candidatus Woesearchaeota archaeon CG11_big_fil_rev_8_21_14_0_20_57_5]